MNTEQKAAFTAMREALKDMIEHAHWLGAPVGYSQKDFAPIFDRADKALALADAINLES